METETIDRKLTAFRIREDLLNRLRVAAKKENRSLNNYVENVLMNVIYDEPNETTLETIREARSGNFAGTIDTSSMDAFIKSCER
jgi:hypothetical protein